ncbi:phytoene/squalene synthase family protein [Pseudonocardia acaciae]|uniref:phytoene/squalene synthase family protein n=1 Tax=Pseudonocardia acaciae TaxID=551276 RepID=UPI000686A0B2|nr:phytoene/squalene synthase family protein [Pseudonocardia acaciae]
MADRASRELDAAGVDDPSLRDAYTQVRTLHAAHGRSYFRATGLLAPAQRPAVHALYGFARHADEIVDSVTDGRSPAEKAAALDELETGLKRALAGEPEPNPVLLAVADTARRYRLDPGLFTAFLTSMRMDTHVTEYATFADLDGYMHGSAAVIGLQMLPVLGTVGPPATAEPTAAALGVAFQLTNFLRDVGEDLDRGRLYLPADELSAFGVDRELLRWCRRRRRQDSRVRRALAHLVARTCAVYRRAAPGIELLAPVSRPCIATAYALYAAILDRIADADYDVLYRRVTVPPRRRAAVALRALPAAYTAQRRHGRHGTARGRSQAA